MMGWRTTPTGFQMEYCARVQVDRADRAVSAAVEPQATAALLEDRQAIRTTEPPATR
jgi:hypothetical protein